MRSKAISCAFSGHRPEKLPWGENERDLRCMNLKERLHGALEQAYHDGYRHFICGMARGCDMYFCEEALALRVFHPDITIEAAVPCLTQANSWPECEQLRYRELIARCDQETLIQEKYTPGCMHRRNRYMVDHSDKLIAVHDGMPGGTHATIEYAFSRQSDVLILPIEASLHI